MKNLSIIYPYYDNPGMLALQYGVWATYPEDLKPKCEVILVDDGSPNSPAIDVTRPEGLPRLRIYRVKMDTPWHQHGARNLGAKEADGQWLFMSDMDHVLPPSSLRKLFECVNGGKIYTFARLDSWTMQPTLREGGGLRLHPNTFAMTRELYWQIGGYDEDYCGLYGTDALFRERAYKVAQERWLSDVPVLRYTRDIIPDASTRTLKRKEGRDPNAKEKIAAQKFAEGRANEVKVLAFPWERVL